MSDPFLAEQVQAALRDVLDPELGESIVDLGLVERIEVGRAGVEVSLIPTSATCPMADLLVEDATLAVQRVVPGDTLVQVRLEDTLEWTPARMSPALRERFGWSTDEPGTR